MPRADADRTPQALPHGLPALTAAQRRDLAFAVALADELSPLPARARTGLLILRDTLADMAGISTAELSKALTPNSNQPHGPIKP